MKISPLNIRSVLDSPPPVLDFVLPGLTPGSVGTIVGAGGIGKTTLLLQIAMALAIDAPAAGGVFDSTGEPCRVVLIATEESANILRIRIHAINNWMTGKGEHAALLPRGTRETQMALMEKNLILVPGAGEPVYLIKDGERTDFFEALCKYCLGARLIIIDPLRRLHDGDENNSAAMTHIVQALETLGKRTGAAVIAAHHVGKGALFNGVSDSASASRGSSALTDAVRWQLNLSGMSDTEAKAFGVAGERKSYLRLDFAKANYLPPQSTIWLRRLEGGVLNRVNIADGNLRKTAKPYRPKQGVRTAGEGDYV